MKKSVFFLGMVSLLFLGCKNEVKNEVVSEEIIETETPVIDMHNSQNSLDWAGVYSGIMPCADCEGIKTKVAIRNDETFTISQTYLGKMPENQSFDDNGSFTWDASGAIINLQAQGTTMQFQVGENKITLLDITGKKIEGDLAEHYVLQKQ